MKPGHRYIGKGTGALRPTEDNCPGHDRATHTNTGGESQKTAVQGSLIRNIRQYSAIKIDGTGHLELDDTGQPGSAGEKSKLMD